MNLLETMLRETLQDALKFIKATISADYSQPVGYPFIDSDDDRYQDCLERTWARGDSGLDERMEKIRGLLQASDYDMIDEEWYEDAFRLIKAEGYLITVSKPNTL